MNRIKRIYRTFIPFLVIFIGMLLLIFLMDGYAERLTRKPEVIVINGLSGSMSSDPFSWQTNQANDQAIDEGLSGDSLYSSARSEYRRRDNMASLQSFNLLKSKYPQSPVPLNYLGLIEIRKGNYPAAAAHFEAAILLDSTYSDALINLASVYSKMRRLSMAKSLYQRALLLRPNDPDIHYNMGLLCREQQNREDASESFSTSIELSSGKKRARAYVQRGILRLQYADTLAAREDFNEAILLEPDNELARINYSRTLNDPQQQLEEIRKVYNLNNRSFYANYYLGKYFEENGNPVQSEYHYKKSLEQDPSNADVIESLTNLMIRQNRLEEAELVVDGLTVGDTLPQAYFLKAKMAASRGETEAATQLYGLAIERSRDNYPEAYVNLAILKKEQGESTGAIRNYREAIRSRTGYSLAWYNLALIYAESDSLQKAIDAYMNAIKHDSTSFKSWYNLGQLYEESGDRLLEIEAYGKALQIKPDYTRALLEMGNAFLDLNDYEAAVRAYNKLLAYYPKYTKALFNLGLAYSRMDRDDQARNAYERLLELQPDHVSGRINLAILYARINQIDLAISTLEEAMNIDMDNPDIRYNLALQYEKKEMMDEAAYQYIRVIELEPDRMTAYDQLMELYSDMGDEAAKAVFEFRKNKQLGTDLDYYQVGKQLHDMEQYVAAIEAYRYALELGDSNRWIIYWIGKALMDMDEIRKGIPYFEEVIEIDPEHKFSWYRLGQTYDMLGDIEKAETYYAKLRQLDPDFKIVRRN